MRLKRSVFMAMATALCMPFVAQGAFPSFPFSDFFESGSIDGAWVKSGSGNAVATSDEKVTGTYGMSVYTNVLTLTGPAGNTNVWTIMHAKPVFVDDLLVRPSVAATDAIAFYFSSQSNKLRVYNGIEWQDADDTATFAPNTWIRLAIHANFASGEWQIYTGSSGATTLTKASPPLQMNDDYGDGDDEFAALVIEAGEHAYFDDVGLSAPALEDVDNDNVSLIRTTAGLTTLHVPGHDYGGAGDRLMSGRLGFDLRAGLVTGDKVWVPMSTGAGFMEFRAGSPYTPLGGEYEEGPVNRTTQIVVQRGTGSDYFAFFPYTTLSTILDTPSNNGGNPTVWGTNFDNDGFNAYVWPHIFAKTVSTSIGFSGALAGDRILTINPNRTCFFDGSTWREGRNPATATLSPGQAFWYYRAASGFAVWTVAGVNPY